MRDDYEWLPPNCSQCGQPLQSDGRCIQCQKQLAASSKTSPLNHWILAGLSIFVVAGSLLIVLGLVLIEQLLNAPEPVPSSADLIAAAQGSETSLGESVVAPPSELGTPATRAGQMPSDTLDSEAQKPTSETPEFPADFFTHFAPPATLEVRENRGPASEFLTYSFQEGELFAYSYENKVVTGGVTDVTYGNLFYRVEDTRRRRPQSVQNDDRPPANDDILISYIRSITKSYRLSETGGRSAESVTTPEITGQFVLSRSGTVIEISYDSLVSLIEATWLEPFTTPFVPLSEDGLREWQANFGNLRPAFLDPDRRDLAEIISRSSGSRPGLNQIYHGLWSDSYKAVVLGSDEVTIEGSRRHIGVVDGKGRYNLNGQLSASFDRTLRRISTFSWSGTLEFLEGDAAPSETAEPIRSTFEFHVQRLSRDETEAAWAEQNNQ